MIEEDLETQGAIAKIHAFERFGSILGLERMNMLMERLGNPEKSLSIIHVAGTNGKGSVCKYIYEVLLANNYRAGLYTSPFLEVFNERIELDGAYISNEDLEIYTEKVLAKVEDMVLEGLDSPTEFEVVTAVAFLYFAEKKAEYVVLEVGLGGSGDSTNIVENPLITIITSISYDHMDRLGNTLAEIAGEKAGIIKDGVPVVMGVDKRDSLEMESAAKAIARRAYEKNAVLYDASKIKATNHVENLGVSTFDTKILGTDYSEIALSMMGEHQVRNAITALTALEILRKAETIKVERSRLYAGMKKAVQIGRFEIVKEADAEGGPVILDGAHNPAGAEALAKTVEEHFPGGRILVVTGILLDKDVPGILGPLRRVATDFVATEPDNPRKMSAEELAQLLSKEGEGCVALPDVYRACQYAKERRAKYDAVLFSGSLYLIGKVRGILRQWETL